MKSKMIIKLTVDFLMSAFLLLAMGYQFWGDEMHEWIGTAMFILFIVHHLLNANWYKNINKGSYTNQRMIMTCIDILILIIMLMQMYSGIVLSRYVFTLLPIDSGLSLARKLHILAAYWGFLFMSLHLGLHWNMILHICKKRISQKYAFQINKVFLFLLGILIAGYGAFVFMKRDFITYLLLKNEFVFLDYEESELLFYMDYLAVIGLCIFLAHYGLKEIKKIKFRKMNKIKEY